MAKKTINLGVVPDGVGGDTYRTAMQKVIDNFDELYSGADILRTSNAKGESIRFPDGTQINYGKQVVNATVPAGQGTTWDQFNMTNQPMPFIDASFETNLQLLLKTGTNGTGDALYSCMFPYANVAGVAVYSALNTGVKPSAAHPSFTLGSIAAQSFIVHFLCVGRWK